MSGDEVYSLLKESEAESYKFVSQELKMIFRQIGNQNLLRKFNDIFKKDDKGNRREWREVETPQIKELFENAKEKVTHIFKEITNLTLPTDITQMDASETP